jgi:hypothetical protein
MSAARTELSKPGEGMKDVSTAPGTVEAVAVTAVFVEVYPIPLKKYVVPAVKPVTVIVEPTVVKNAAVYEVQVPVAPVAY